ncbi:MAG: hypothetical protein R8P61_07685 [Bacteroidia bacterium]|nr:hypothetical protein [Bacteroidia bacterium]
MRKISVETYNHAPDQYELRKGSSEGAPLCPYGNSYQWIGFDKNKGEYVRFTKRLFKRLVNAQ